MAAVTRGISSASARSTSIPIFLAPAFSQPCSLAAIPSSRFFSSSAPRGKSESKAGETNKKRGVSAMRGTGPLVNRGLWAYSLPEPVTRTRVPQQSDYEDTADHGLWGFFHQDRQAMLPPDTECSHGRAWSYAELSIKSFDDLHKLYWLCVKEQNQILTRSKEMKRVRAGFGQVEVDEKIKVVRATMKRIRKVLADRKFVHDEGMALFYETPLSQLLPNEVAPEDVEFYTESKEFEGQIEEVEEIPAAKEVITVKKKSKTWKPRLNLKNRVLMLK